MFSFLKRALRKVLKLFRRFSFLVRESLKLRRNYALMSQITKQAPPLSTSEQTILFWVPGGMPLLLDVEGMVATALRLRGIPAHAVICDGAFRACINREVTDSVPVSRWHEACAKCKANTSNVLKTMQVPYSFIGDFLPASLRAELWNKTAGITWEQLEQLEYEGVNLSKSTRSAIVRYLKGEALAGHEEIVREYAYSALMCAAASTCAIKHHTASRLFLSHGVYVDWGPALLMALALGIRVSGWKPSYLYSHFYFRHIEDGARLGFHRLSQTAWEKRKATPLLPSQDSRLDTFMMSRYKGQANYDLRERKPYYGNLEQIREKYVADPNKPVWGIMCHINWDSVKDYSPMAFDSFNDWMMVTVQEIINIEKVNWIIKIHPAEARDKRLLGIQDLIDTQFSSLPSHVRVISAEEEISPLEFFQLIDGGISVYGTSGLELALQGKPVILAGEAHYGGKGFTYEGLCPEDYVNLLHRASSIPRLSEAQIALARQYAYNYFIQREIPLAILKDSKPNPRWFKFQYEKGNLLLRGNDAFIDFICEHILNNQDFVMEENLIELSQGER